MPSKEDLPNFTKTLKEGASTVARRFHWRLKRPNTNSSNLYSTIKRAMDEGAECTRVENFCGAVEKFNIALDAANELYDCNNDDMKNRGVKKSKKKEVENICERLAEAYLSNGDFDEALTIYTDLKDDHADEPNKRRYNYLVKKEMDIMEKIKRKHARKHKVEFQQLYQLGQINVKIENYDKARMYFQKAMNVVKIRYGVEHSYVLEVRENLADIHVIEDNISAAISIYRSLLSTLEKKYGDNHDRYLTVLQKLAEIDTDQMERRSTFGY